MTILQVLKKNKNVSVLTDCFRVFVIPNNFLVYTNGNVSLNVIADGEYKAAVYSAMCKIYKMPPSIPEFLQTNWSFSQQITDEEAEELTKFLNNVYDVLH